MLFYLFLYLLIGQWSYYAHAVTYIKLGGIFSPEEEDSDQSQCLAAFIEAVDQVNSNNIMNGYEFRVAVTSAVDSYEGVIAAQYLSSEVDFVGSDGNYFSGSKKGVDAVIGSGTDDVTETSNLVFPNYGVVQLHTRAMDTKHGYGNIYPYKVQTTPIDSFQGMVWQHIMCNTFKYTQYTVFATNDDRGTKTSMESGDDTYCDLTKLSEHFFRFSDTDFTEVIAHAKLAGAKVFLLVMPAATAALLLEQGYDSGLFHEGTQIFGVDTLSKGSEIIDYMETTDPVKIKKIMKGVMTVEYAPSFNILNAGAGADFLSDFQGLTNTANCVTDTDDTVTGNFLYKTSTGTCTGISDFSSITHTTISDYAAHVYDAVFSMAYAFKLLIHNESYTSFDPVNNGTVLHEILMNNISFDGATGYIKYFSGMPQFSFYGEGDREEGHTFIVKNFNADWYDSNPADPWAYVGYWQGELDTIAWCSNSDSWYGHNCTDIIYNTYDGKPAKDGQGYTNAETPRYVKVGGFFNPHDPQQAQSLEAFIMAIEEINNSTELLPNTTLVYSIYEGEGFQGGSQAAQYLGDESFGTGVDIVIGQGNDVETFVSNKYFQELKLTQIHTLAQDTMFGIGDEFPYKLQTVIVETYQGMVWQEMICNYFKWGKFASIAVDLDFGYKISVESSDLTYCETERIAEEYVNPNIGDSTLGDPDLMDDMDSLVKSLKSSGAKIFFLALPVNTTARVIEALYDGGVLGVGTQLLGIGMNSVPELLAGFQTTDHDKIKNMMRGYMGFQYKPDYSLRESPYGTNFVQNFLSRTDTVTTHNGVTVCDGALDDASEYFLYHYQNDSTICTGVEYSSLDEFDIYPYTPHAYDAVYTAAHGIHDLFYEKGLTSIDSDLLQEVLEKNISFSGATGYLKFFEGMPLYRGYGKGDREVGHTFLVYQFQDKIYDAWTARRLSETYPNEELSSKHAVSSSNSATKYQSKDELEGFALIAKWTNENSFESCTSLYEYCFEAVYNSLDGLPVRDAPPTIYIRHTPGIRGFLVFLGVFTIILSLSLTLFTIYYRKSNLVKLTQYHMTLVTLFGSFLCGIRIILDSRDLTSEICVSEVWIGHYAYIFMFGSLFLKTYRIHRLLNNKGFKRVRFSNFQLMVLMLLLCSGVGIYLIALTVVGEPHMSVKSRTSHNQEYVEYNCTMHNPKFLIALYVLEAIFLLVGATLTWAVRDVVDSVNESKSIATAISFIFIIVIFAFPIIYLVKVDPTIQGLLSAVAFTLASNITLVILFMKKVSILYHGNDVDGIYGKVVPRECPVGFYAVEFSVKIAAGDKYKSKPTSSLSDEKGGIITVNGVDILADQKFLKGSFEHKVKVCREQVELWKQLLLRIEDGSSGGTNSKESDPNKQSSGVRSVQDRVSSLEPIQEKETVSNTNYPTASNMDSAMEP